MNAKYLFLLGRNETLSRAELLAVFSDVRFKKRFDGFFEGNVTLDNPQKFLDKIGGALQILEVIKEGIPVVDIENILFEILKKNFEGQTSKVTFGLNAYGNLKNSLRQYLLITKKNLKAEGLKVRFVNKNFQNVARGVIFEEKLVSQGMDLSIFPDGNNVTIAKTVALQDVEGYEKRDYGKPYRDAKAGMLPPKLAQMMINIALAQYKNNSESPVAIVDPFCGTGTVLMEAILMGHPVIGSDIDPKMVEGAKQNLEWLKKNFKISTNLTENVFQNDAVTVKIPDINIAIVTEPFLGPPMIKLPSLNQLKKIMEGLENLYFEFFKNIKMWAPKGTPIVFLFPCFRDGKSWIHLPSLIEKIESLGYRRVVLSSSGRLIYDRPDQIVGRVISCFSTQNSVN